MEVSRRREIRLLTASSLTADSLLIGSVSLTLLKIPLALAVYFLLSISHTSVAGLLILSSIVVDVADGVLFRRSPYGQDNQLLRARAVLDAHTDRILILLVGWSVFAFADLHVATFSHFMIREILLGVLLAMPFYSKRVVHKPNWISKLATGLMGLFAGLFCILNEEITLLLILFDLSAVAGLALYVLRPRFY